MGKGKNSPGRLPLLRERWTGCVAKTLFKSRAEQVPHDRVAAGGRERCVLECFLEVSFRPGWLSSVCVWGGGPNCSAMAS